MNKLNPQPVPSAVILCLAFLSFCSTSLLPAQEQQRKGKVDEAVGRAHAQGKTSVILDSSPGYPAEPSSYEEMRKFMACLDVSAIASAPALDKGHHRVVTWYKFSVNADLSDNPLLPRSPTFLDDPSIPESLLPVTSNQILVMTGGGRIKIDGIDVTFGDPSELFHPGHRYFLMLDRTDESISNHRYGLSSRNGASFIVKSDGDSLAPVIPRTRELVQLDVARIFHNSLAAIVASQGAKH